MRILDRKQILSVSSVFKVIHTRIVFDKMQFHFIVAICIVSILHVELSNCESSSNNEIEVFKDLTSKEKNVIEKVKQILGPNWLYRDYMKTDKYLVRWVRDADLNAQKASEKIKTFHKFRKENDIDNILNEDWSKIEKKYEYEIVDGEDIEGGRILLISLGKWNPRREILAGEAKRLYRYVHYILEKCDVYVRNSSSVNGTAILNFAGFTYKTHACLACLPFYPYIVNTLENHYPQILKHFYMINIPRAHNLQPLINSLVGLLSPYTRKVFRIFGYDKSEWGPIILKKIPADLLRPEYAGTKKTLN